MIPRLDDLVDSTRDALRRRQREHPLSELAAQVETGREGRPFSEALSRPGTSLIAEHKRRSPSAGTIREGASCAEIVGAYERGGAAAISILTEEAHFGGSLADLREARAATELPILRKDFTIDPYQLYEAKLAGARRGAARGRRRSPTRSWRRCTRRLASSISTPSSRSTTTRSSSGRSSSTAT